MAGFFFGSNLCCWDGGDCLPGPCPTCNFGSQKEIGDGVCQEELNNEDCCFDGGDCGEVVQDCSDTIRVNDGVCDLDLFECGLDGGDCLGMSLLCPTCLAPSAGMRLGTGECDQDLNNLHCCYDGGDCHNLLECPTCQSFLEPYSWRYINDGICDRMNYHPACCFDGEDCHTNQDETVCRGCNEYRRKAFPHVAAEISNLEYAPDDLKCKYYDRIPNNRVDISLLQSEPLINQIMVFYRELRPGPLTPWQ